MTPDTSRTWPNRRHRRGTRGVTAAAAATPLACSKFALIGTTTGGGQAAAAATACPWAGSGAPVSDSSASLPLTAHVEVNR